MSAHGAATKPGTGENRMTTTGFKVPLVEKVSVPSSQGYEWKVKADVLDAKKLNMQEKVKLAKPGLSIIDELEKLAAEAKEKGGAQHLDDDDITLRLKWMGLFHRGKIVPGTFMWRFRVPNGVLTSTQWRALGEVAGQYDNGSRDHWEPNGCADVTTRMNVQVHTHARARTHTHSRVIASSSHTHAQTRARLHTNACVCARADVTTRMNIQVCVRVCACVCTCMQCVHVWCGRLRRTHSAHTRTRAHTCACV
jgi:hypothetical protein